MLIIKENMTLQRVQRVCLVRIKTRDAHRDERVACGFITKGVPILIGARGMGGREGIRTDASRTRKSGRDFGHLTDGRFWEERQRMI